MLVTQILYPLADRLNLKMKDTNNILEIIDNINKNKAV